MADLGEPRPIPFRSMKSDGCPGAEGGHIDDYLRYMRARPRSLYSYFAILTQVYQFNKNCSAL